MNRRLLAVAASAVLVAMLMPATAIAAAPIRKFERLDVSKIDPKLGPAMLANKPITVMVQLKGAAATNGKSSKAQQVATAKTLKASQDNL